MSPKCSSTRTAHTHLARMHAALGRPRMSASHTRTHAHRNMRTAAHEHAAASDLHRACARVAPLYSFALSSQSANARACSLRCPPPVAAVQPRHVLSIVFSEYHVGHVPHVTVQFVFFGGRGQCSKCPQGRQPSKRQQGCVGGNPDLCVPLSCPPPRARAGVRAPSPVRVQRARPVGLRSRRAPFRVWEQFLARARASA